MEDALEELEDLWADLKRRHQENGVALREIDTVRVAAESSDLLFCFLFYICSIMCHVW